MVPVLLFGPVLVFRCAVKDRYLEFVKKSVAFEFLTSDACTGIFDPYQAAFC